MCRFDERPPDPSSPPPRPETTGPAAPPTRAEIRAVLAPHFENRHAAYLAHEHAMANEAAIRAKGTKAFHGYGRHGFQTGWMAQLVRIVTKVTPDQSWDPRGVGMTDESRSWTSSDGPRHLDRKGATVRAAPPGSGGGGASASSLGKIQKSGGQSAGYFYGPHVQEQARSALQERAGWARRFSECEIRRAGRTEWVPFKVLYAAVGGPRGGYGASFTPVEGAARGRLSPDDVREAVDDFLRWTTIEDYLKRSGSPLPAEQVVGPFRTNPYRFPTWGDLLRFLGVEQRWMTSVRGEFGRKTGGGDFSLFTFFPVADVEGIGVGGIPPQSEWTGRLREPSGIVTTLNVPSWARE